MTNSRRQHGIGSLAPDEKIVGKPGGIVEPVLNSTVSLRRLKNSVRKYSEVN